jgi:hypothetical protein
MAVLNITTWLQKPLRKQSRYDTQNHFFRIAFMMAAGIPGAQETHRTVVNTAPNPSDDTKPNTSAVPEAYALTGHFDRIVVIRLKNGANLLEGMMQVVKEQDIKKG